MAMNKVHMAFTLVFIFSLLAVSLVESRTLTADILEEKKPNIAEASSSVEADHSVKGNNDKLNGALPKNLEPNVLLSKHTKPTSSLRPIRTTDDAKPIRMKVDGAKPIWLTEYKPTWLIDDPNPVMTGDDNIDVQSTQVTDQHVIDKIPNTNSESTKNVQSTQVIDEPEGTATAGTEQTPTSVRKSMMRNLPTELAKAYSTSSSGFEELSSVTEEIPKTKPESTDNVKTVPRAIGAHVFYGKMVSGSEMYNMTTDEYYNQIYPTHKCDVFLIGKLLRVADTPHNCMVFAKFAEEESDGTSDDSTEKDVPIDH